MADAGVPIDAAAPRPQLDAAADRDDDGLDDEEEGRLASAYLPFLSIAADDACPTSGLVVRVTPAERAGLVRLRYAWLFDRACMPAVIDGDGGSFSMVVDPTQAGAAGILSLRAIARRDTSCEVVSTCGTCVGQSACQTLGSPPRAAVWAARDRHSIYVDRPVSCTQTGACLASCVDAAASAAPPIVNVGEPSAPLIHDLTDEGFIRPELGWMSPELLHYAPFGGRPFGNAPPVSDLIASTLIDPPLCAE